jgi:dTDP-glucose 4,6-dehydratase
MISNAIADEPLPIYGDGLQVCGWLYVADHCEALKGRYSERPDRRDIQHCGQLSTAQSGDCNSSLEMLGKSRELMRTVSDRPGHDRRYAMCADKIARDTRWRPRTSFNDGLRTTIQWYNDNPEWMKQVRSGDYEAYYLRQYAHRFHVDEDD